MESRANVRRANGQRGSVAGVLALAAFCLGWSAPAAAAKDAPLTAIELYDGQAGAAFVQLSDVLINGKAEMRDCSQFESVAVDKSTYNKMSRVLLAAGGVLERGPDGILRYDSGRAFKNHLRRTIVLFQIDYLYIRIIPDEVGNISEIRTAPGINRIMNNYSIGDIVMNLIDI